MGRGNKFNNKRRGGGGGRGGRGGGFSRDYKRQKRDDRGSGQGRKEFSEIKMENAAFEAYYKAQKIVPEGEWEEFMTSLRTALPLTFRINGSGKFATDMRDQLEGTLFAELLEQSLRDEETQAEIPPPKPLAWYPERLPWQCSYTRSQLRRMPVLQGIFDFIKNANELGSISRQEAVSMIPPFFLDTQPHHRILDMCASPGSKTFQILERMHGDFDGTSKLPTGFVVANDVDLKRCNLLTHQTKRANSPTLLVTNHEAQNYPIIKGPRGEVFDFDAILCDVPCSGDATMRKAPDIWNRWVPGNGNGLHALQLKIATRGAELLKVGGRLVYSTCSLNPIENEAVVAALLKGSNGALELMDVSKELPDLKRSPGLHEWQVWDKFGYHPSFDGEEQMYKLSKTMFSDEETKKLPMERCLRLLPHHQDTGGFFVAVFQKVKHMDAKEDPKGQEKSVKERVRVNLTVDEHDSIKLAHEIYTLRKGSSPIPPGVDEKGEYLLPHRAARGPNGGSRWLGIDPVLPVNDPKVIDSIYQVYGIESEEVPLHKNCVTRTSDTSRPKRIYTITDSLRQYLACDVNESLRVTSCGLKAFERQEIKEEASGSCDFRLTQDGLPMMFPFVKKRIIRPTYEDFKNILERRTLAFEHSADAPQRAVIADADTKRSILDLTLGCCILIPRDEDLSKLNCAKADLAIACWRGRTSCNLLVSKAETIHFVDKLKVSTAGHTNKPMETS